MSSRTAMPLFGLAQAVGIPAGFPLLLIAFVACAPGNWGVTGRDASDATAAENGGTGPDRTGEASGEDPGIGPPDSILRAEDLGTPETPVQDPGAGADDATTAPDLGPDLTRPQVVSAFSADGKGITVRFSEAIEPQSVAPERFTVQGSDNSILPVTAATASGVFAALTLDPKAQINPALTYTVYVVGVRDLAGNEVDPKAKSAKVKRSVYVALVWHQHQPTYLDVTRDQLSGPWVRKHATKDYYDMAAILGSYAETHVTMNLTAVLLTQLLDYYVARLGPYVDTNANRVDEAAFLAAWRGRTDPWIDLLLDDTPDPEGLVAAKPTDRQLELFYNAPWSCLSTSDALMAFFPEYKALRDRAPVTYTHDDLLRLKILFEIAWFDPDFLNGPVQMPDGSVVDLSDVVRKDAAGRFTLAVPASEDLANRLVAEEYKVMKNVVAIHKALRFDPAACASSGACEGQIELTTTPFYHPILPLIYDSDLAKKVQPYDTMPERFHEPEDARAHVLKGVRYFQDLFGAPPLGMWPGEGSVAEEVVSTFVDAGVRWVATDKDVLLNTLQKMGQPIPPCAHCRPYRLDADLVGGDGGNSSDEMAIVFRDTGLSNKLGWTYQPMWGQVAASDFLADLLNMAPAFGGPDRLVTVVLDGENAWESYLKEQDGKGFLHALYRALNDAAILGEVVPVTVAEYLLGNPTRQIPPHPIHDLPELEPLQPGSWIGGDFAVWIGEPEENAAWGYLSQARKALTQSGLPRPDPLAAAPADTASLAYQTYRAYEEMYAAEGSDWFWWYGDDMTSPANDDTPFDIAFRSHLHGMYDALNHALTMQGKPAILVPDFPPLVQAKAKAPTGPFTIPPVLDGQISPSETWTSEGGLFYDNDSGSIANPLDDIAAVYYGYTADRFYCALQFNQDLNQKVQTPFAVSLYFSHKHIVNAQTGEFQQNPMNTKDRFGGDLLFLTGGAAWEVRMDFSKNPPAVSLSRANGTGGWTAVGTAGVQVGGPSASGAKVLEFAIPFASLQLALGDPLEFLATTGDGGGARDRAPNLNGKLVFEDPTNLVYVTFEVDVTGQTVALDTYGPINNPPPPKGKGIVYIAGNQDKLGLWIPNKIALRDDGVAPDAKAGDGVWSATFGFMPGTLLRYKYTIGIPTDEGKWSGTEEFPLTERGFEVTKDPTCKKMKVHDLFADRPQPTGTLGPKSTLESCVP